MVLPVEEKSAKEDNKKGYLRSQVIKKDSVVAPHSEEKGYFDSKGSQYEAFGLLSVNFQSTSPLNVNGKLAILYHKLRKIARNLRIAFLLP